jgi:hypothetical protein
MKGEVFVLPTLLMVENLLGFYVALNFISTGDWGVAVAYASGDAVAGFVAALRVKQELHKSAVHSQAKIKEEADVAV